MGSGDPRIGIALGNHEQSREEVEAERRRRTIPSARVDTLPRLVGSRAREEAALVGEFEERTQLAELAFHLPTPAALHVACEPEDGVDAVLVCRCAALHLALRLPLEEAGKAARDAREPGPLNADVCRRRVLRIAALYREPSHLLLERELCLRGGNGLAEGEHCKSRKCEAVGNAGGRVQNVRTPCVIRV